MNYGNLTWEEALLESHKTLLKTHPRSPKKLIPPHQWIKETLKEHLGDGYEYYAAGPTDRKYDKEHKVPGLLYDKKEDVVILKNNEVIGVVSFKFIASNYAQNSNNYFENLLGECYNIQANNIPFCHVFVTRYEIPYYNDKKKLTKHDEFKGRYLNKYLKLVGLEGNDSIPKKVSLTIINITGGTYNGAEIHPTEFKKLKDYEKKEILGNVDLELYDCSLYGPEIATKLEQLEVHKVLEEFADIIRVDD